MKDLFSSDANAYSRFRPTYPAELYKFLRERILHSERAWDCGTGNGQVAGELAGFIDQVYATDISVQQLAHAVQRSNIHYTKQPAEKTGFPEDFFDLITVGQAVHWFEFDQFYSEVKRVSKKEAVIALFGYSLFKNDHRTNEVIHHFYNNIIGEFWPAERQYLQNDYRTIPFPLKEIEVPKLKIKEHWSFERLTGYLNTWSAVKAYEKEHGENPVELIKADLYNTFGNVGSLSFPIIFRAGRV